MKKVSKEGGKQAKVTSRMLDSLVARIKCVSAELANVITAGRVSQDNDQLRKLDCIKHQNRPTLRV